jgi:hypothetical protein
MADITVNGNGNGLKKKYNPGIFNVIKDITLIIGMIATIGGFFIWINTVNIDIAVIKKDINTLSVQVQELVNLHPRTQGGIIQ